MNTHTSDKSVTQLRWCGRLALVVSVIVAAWLLARPGAVATRSADSPQPAAAKQATLASYAPTAGTTAPAQTDTRPIETIRVGQRVLARNPEVTASERASWQEPDWSQWVHLSLQMPLPTVGEDGQPALLAIEIIRPESWLRERIGWVTDRRDANAAPTSAPGESTSTPSESTGRTTSLPAVPLSPLRGIYRDIAITSAVLDAGGIDAVGLTLELDLPEMGASGTAVITNIRSYPTVASGTGQVVTATFSHPPANQVLDVQFEGERRAIGVTDNHLFWSVDRLEFLPIGEMELGERVQTFNGDTKRIEQKLPRPGPQVVYNLEVYGEHVYFVGEQGLLAHNMYEGGRSVANRNLTRAEWKAHYRQQRLQRRTTSTYRQRYNQTPVSNGAWSGPRAESVFTSTNPEVNGFSVRYQHAYADLTPYAKHTVSIDNFASLVQNASNPRYNLHRVADSLLAGRLGVNPSVINKFRRSSGFTWHEVQDMRTLQLVPTAVNSKFGHLGGISETLGQ